jgi:hypothetical protein
MSGSVSINPLLTSVAAGSFNVESVGYIQGTAMNSPAVRNYLTIANLAATETLPMWGGVGISEYLPGTSNISSRSLARATSLSGAIPLTGFSVFDQAHAMVNSPQSPVPLAPQGGTVSFYRLGTGARIAVACDPLLASLLSGPIGAQVSWDFGSQQLTPYNASYNANVITASTWAAGVATLTTTSAHGVGVGIDINLTGFVSNGVTLNGNFQTIAGTTGSTLKFNFPATFGTVTTQGTLVAGGGAVNVKVLDVLTSGNMTVSYNPTTGFATWNRSGSTALILI